MVRPWSEFVRRSDITFYSCISLGGASLTSRLAPCDSAGAVVKVTIRADCRSEIKSDKCSDSIQIFRGSRKLPQRHVHSMRSTCIADPHPACASRFASENSEQYIAS